MTEQNATVKNEQGIHCRPAAVILKEMKDYEGEILIISQNGETKLNSVMGLLSLGLDQGSEIIIRVEGPQEEAICRRLVDLFEYHFDFPARD